MNTTTDSPKENPANNAATSVSESPAPAGGLPQSSVESDRVLVRCPHCKAVLSVRRIRLADGIRCKQCNQTLLAPAASGDTPTRIYDGIVSPAASESPAATQKSASPGSEPASSALLDRISKLVATNDELRSARDQLEVERTKLQAAHDELFEELRHANSELNTIRSQLGAIAPAEVLPLVSERDALSNLVRDLRDQVQALSAECHTLAARLQSHEASLSSQGADREAIAGQLSDPTAELTAAHTELCRLRDQLERAEADLAAIGRQRDETGQQIEAYKDDIASLQADLARLNSEQQSSSETIERLTRTIAERDLDWEKQREEWSAEVARTREAFESARETHGTDYEKLNTEQEALRAKYDRLSEEHRSAELLCAHLQAKNDEAALAHEKNAAQSQAELEAEREKQRRLAEEVVQLRANAAQTGQAIRPVTPEELGAARRQAEDLKRGLAESERMNRLLAKSLDRMGIHVKGASEPPKPGSTLPD
jgi:chromosome segregation ATPase